MYTNFTHIDDHIISQVIKKKTRVHIIQPKDKNKTCILNPKSTVNVVEGKKSDSSMLLCAINRVM